MTPDEIALSIRVAEALGAKRQHIGGSHVNWELVDECGRHLAYEKPGGRIIVCAAMPRYAVSLDAIAFALEELSKAQWLINIHPPDHRWGWYIVTMSATDPDDVWTFEYAALATAICHAWLAWVESGGRAAWLASRQDAAGVEER